MVSGAIVEFGLYAVLMVLSPFSVRQIAPADIVGLFAETGMQSSRSLVFMTSAPKLGVDRQGSFFDINPNVLVLDVGRFIDEGLEESCFSMRSEDEDVIKIGKVISGRIRKMTVAGVTAINPTTGAMAVIRAHRFTDGALKLEDAGIKMLPVAGTSIIRLRKS